MPLYHVLVVTNLWPTDADPGYGSFVEAQVDSLRPLGGESEILFIDGRASRWNYWRAVGRLRRRLREKRFDLIHAHFGLSGWVARLQARVPVVVSFLGDDVLGRPKRSGRITFYGRILRASSYLLARLAAGVIVKSPEMKSRLRLDSARVIPNGVDLQLFQPLNRQEARRELGLDPGRKYVLFPYDPAEARKRFDLIEAAVARAREHVPQVEILHARRVPRRRMPLYMNAADLLVLASLLEGSPNAVKEAMACNLPIVATDAGDVRELLGPTESCFVVPREAGAIADKIVEVCRRAERTNGREWIAQWSMPNAARQILQVYADVLRARRTKCGPGPGQTPEAR